MMTPKEKAPTAMRIKLTVTALLLLASISIAQTQTRFSYLISDVVARYFEPAAPADPNAPDAFRFAEPGSLARILTDAGDVDVKECEFKFHIAAPVSPKKFWEMRSEISGTLREKLATLSTLQADSLAQEAQDAVRHFFSNNEMSIPAQMIIVRGRKP